MVENESVADVNITKLIKEVNRALKGKDEDKLLDVRAKLSELGDSLTSGHQEPVIRMLRAVDRRLGILFSK